MVYFSRPSGKVYVTCSLPYKRTFSFYRSSDSNGLTSASVRLHSLSVTPLTVRLDLLSETHPPRPPPALKLFDSYENVPEFALRERLPWLSPNGGKPIPMGRKSGGV